MARPGVTIDEQIGEFGLIARYFKPLARDPAALGLGDDAAVLPAGAGESDLVVTTDAMVSGVHFLPDDPPDSIGEKVLAVNLSDLAAMGARPFGHTLAIALPADWSTSARDSWLSGFTAGLDHLQRKTGCVLLGGDTVATPGPLTLSVTALGFVASGKALRRSGARPGDHVVVSGTIGDGLLGLRCLQNPPKLDAENLATVIHRYRRPQPRTTLGPRLIGLAHGCADVSDGLIADLGHICVQSRLKAVVTATDVPLSPAVRQVLADDPTFLPALLNGGDDYELVFTVAPERSMDVAELAVELSLPLTTIGHLEPLREGEQAAVAVLDSLGTPINAAGGWQHF